MKRIRIFGWSGEIPDLDFALPVLSMAATISLTSYAEWKLAVHLDIHPIAAVAMPVAIDVYAIAALRRGRWVDVWLSLTLAWASFVVSHAIDEKLVQVTLATLAVVGALLVLSLRRTKLLSSKTYAPRRMSWKTRTGRNPSTTSADRVVPRTSSAKPKKEAPSPSTSSTVSLTKTTSSSSGNSRPSSAIEAAWLILNDWPEDTKKPGRVVLQKKVREQYGLVLSEHHAKQLVSGPKKKAV